MGSAKLQPVKSPIRLVLVAAGPWVAKPLAFETEECHLVEGGPPHATRHCISGTNEVVVRLSSGDVFAADIVGTAPNYDLGVVRLRNPRQLPPAIAIGSSADLKVGQFAFAVGNPFGLDQSLTFGVISALRRRLPTKSGHQIANRSRPMQRLIPEIPAAHCWIRAAGWWASTQPSSHPRDRMPASDLQSRWTS